jgi:hypothetical protein
MIFNSGRNKIESPTTVLELLGEEWRKRLYERYLSSIVDVSATLGTL